MSTSKNNKFAVEVIPGLFLGNQYAASKIEWLKNNNIKAIVNVGGGRNKYESDFRYLKISIKDNVDSSLLQYFDEASDFINSHLQDKSPILVHCRGGFSRSPSIIIAYFIKYQQKTFEEAFDLIKSKRSCINPNQTFSEELKIFHHNCKEKVTGE